MPDTGCKRAQTEKLKSRARGGRQISAYTNESANGKDEIGWTSHAKEPDAVDIWRLQGQSWAKHIGYVEIEKITY